MGLSDFGICCSDFPLIMQLTNLLVIDLSPVQQTIQDREESLQDDRQGKTVIDRVMEIKGEVVLVT